MVIGMSMKSERTRVVLVVFIGLALVWVMLFSAMLIVQVPEGVHTAIYVLGCLLLAVGGTRLAGIPKPIAHLGLLKMDLRGIAVAFGGSLPMLVGLLLAAPTAPVLDLHLIWAKAVQPGVIEELVFRGFAFGLLYQRARWSFPAAMLITGAAFGCAHLPGAIVSGQLDQAVGTTLITGVGGCWFAWLFVRWGQCLWVPITTHVSMNLWWTLFTAGPTAAGGGPGTTWGRLAAIAIITVATLKMTTKNCPIAHKATGWH